MKVRLSELFVMNVDMNTIVYFYFYISSFYKFMVVIKRNMIIL